MATDARQCHPLAHGGGAGIDNGKPIVMRIHSAARTCLFCYPAKLLESVFGSFRGPELVFTVPVATVLAELLRPVIWY
jgi:hypothetical protein